MFFLRSTRGIALLPLVAIPVFASKLAVTNFSGRDLGLHRSVGLGSGHLLDVTLAAKIDQDGLLTEVEAGPQWEKAFPRRCMVTLEAPGDCRGGEARFHLVDAGNPGETIAILTYALPPGPDGQDPEPCWSLEDLSCGDEPALTLAFEPGTPGSAFLETLGPHASMVPDSPVRRKILAHPGLTVSLDLNEAAVPDQDLPTVDPGRVVSWGKIRTVEAKGTHGDGEKQDQEERRQARKQARQREKLEAQLKVLQDAPAWKMGRTSTRMVQLEQQGMRMLPLAGDVKTDYRLLDSDLYADEDTP